MTSDDTQQAAPPPRETLWIVFSKEGADIVYPVRYMAMEQASIMAGEHPDMGPWRVAEYAPVAAQQTPLLAERDAARYWFLRQLAEGIEFRAGNVWRSDAPRMEQLDAAIDAAIASQAGERDA